MPRKVRPIRVEGDVAFVTLTRGYTATIDATDVALVASWNWTALVTPRGVYARRSENKRGVYMHRVIAGDPDGMEVDHADRNGLNNRRANLRVATAQQNKFNRARRVGSSSGVKGVSWERGVGKWRARIMVDQRPIHLGLFANKDDAAAAYAKASAWFHGAFGRTD